MKWFSFFVISILAVLSSVKAADQFTPNHLFVGGRQTNTPARAAVFEFDQQGTLVRTIAVSDGADQVYGVAFGPDGNLYVGAAWGDRVVSVSPSLVVTTVLDASNGIDYPDALSFGPDGTLYVANRYSDQIVTRSSAGVVGIITNSTPGWVPAAVTFGVAGNRYVTDGGNLVIREEDPNGREVRTIGDGVLPSYPANVVEGPNGLLYISGYGSSTIFVFNPDGTEAFHIQHADMSGCYGLAFGPNGNLFVSSWSNSKILEFTQAGVHVQTIQEPSLNYPAYLAFAAFRLAAPLKGTTVETGGAVAPLSEKNAVLSIAPGSRTLMLAVADGGDYAALFGGKWHVFHGFENFSGATATTRLFQGLQVQGQPLTNGIGSLSLTVKGKVNTNGWYSVTSAAGNLQRANEDAQFNGTLKGKLIK